MNINIESIDNAKSLAKSLRTLLKEKAGLQLPVGSSLEVIAGLANATNWDTLHGMLSRVATPKRDFDLLKPDQELTLYLEAYACSSWGDGPQWAKVLVTQKFLNELKRKRQCAIDAKVSQVNCYDSPDAWDEDSDVCLELTELVVTAQGLFWYEAEVKHSDYGVETRGVTLAELEALVKDALAEGRSYLLYSEGDIDGLKCRLAKADELHFCIDCGANHTPAADSQGDLCLACANKDSQDQDNAQN